MLPGPVMDTFKVRVECRASTLTLTYLKRSQDKPYPVTLGKEEKVTA